MKFIRNYRQIIAVILVLAWAHIDLLVVYAANANGFSPNDNTEITEANGEDFQPQDLRQNPQALFDLDTSKRYNPDGPVLVRVDLGGLSTIDTFRLFGIAGYSLSIQKNMDGQWENVDGWENLSLNSSGLLHDGWNAYDLAVPVETDMLRFQLVPLSSGASTIAEMEIWSSGVYVPILPNRVTAIRDSGFSFPGGKAYRAENSTGTIGPEVGEYHDFSNDNLFRFNNAFPIDWVSDVRLRYKLSGLNHWVSAVRVVNDQPAVGGYIIDRGEGSIQTERISPAILRQGENLIRFVPLSDNDNYVVDDVEVLVSFKDGFSEDQDSALGATISALKILSGIGAEAFLADTDQNGKVEIQDAILGLQQAAGLRGEGADPDSAEPETMVSSSPDPGQTNSSPPSASGINLSPTKPLPEESKIVITYPESGQFFGDQVYIRGFVHPYANEFGEIELFCGENSIPHFNGEFEVMLDRTTANAEGEIQIQGAFSNGKAVGAQISLQQNRLSQDNQIQVQPFPGEAGREEAEEEDAEDEEAEEPFDDETLENIPENVNLKKDFHVPPGQAKKLVFAGSEIELSPGALRQATKLSMITLRDRDIPALDPGMINVTGKIKGYRFLPHGMKFQNKVKVKLPYQKGLIPEGFRDEDVRTYFFDEASARWIQLERETVDVAQSRVVSRTDHFTDMINAVVQTPESPQKTSFNPTQLKDLKAANPGAKINLIEPPQANNQGDARLSYPIEIPPGRKGMQPQLALQYSSGGGNGWMGLGWDLPMQAVAIDTRWGVPRYDAELETETYALSGQQLTPLAHRDELAPRTAEKVFHARTEGAFNRIVRHGDHPSNYWWEVTDKNGTRFFYGGDLQTGGPAEDSILTDADGNIAHWALRLVQDSNGNTIQYRCVREYDTGLEAGTVLGAELYLKEIAYTGYGRDEGPFRVTFLRDRELGETKRRDVSIDGRLGFKRVTSDLLRKVEVSYQGGMVRSYEFVYGTGAFEKTLLQSIIQFDKDGQAVNRHDLSYYDEAREDGDYLGFGPGETWDSQDDGIDAGLYKEGHASALGGSKTGNKRHHIYVGINLADPTKDGSIGGKVGRSRSKSKGLVSLTDVNGDGLPDKVFGAGSVFRPNLSGPLGLNVFGEKFEINLGGISISESRMTSFGPESYVAGFVGLNVSNTFTETTSYLSDVNGDGLVDLVDNGTVRFGRPDDAQKEKPIPHYGPDSLETPYPIGQGAIDGEALFDEFDELYEGMIDANPLHDTFRRWTAPYDGTIAIRGDVALREDPSAARSEYESADGVRVAIQHNGRELWSEEIKETDYNFKTPTGIEPTEVKAGDRLYFRVQSRFDGAYDEVFWDPGIEYLRVPPQTDINGLDIFSYQASADFIPAGRNQLAMTLPATGYLQITGDVEKIGATSDDIRVLISLNDEVLFSQTTGFNQIGTIPIFLNEYVSEQDQLTLKIEVDSPIDATQIQWKPHLEYTSAEGVDSLYDEEGNALVAFDPPYLMDIYGDNDLEGPQEYWTAPESGNVLVQCVFSARSETGAGAFTVKRTNELAGKVPFDMALAIEEGSARKAGNGYEIELTSEIFVNSGDRLAFDLSTRNRKLGQSIRSYEISVAYGGQKPIEVPKALHFPAEEGLFAQPYRGWTYAAYNGNDRTNEAILESDLVLPSYDAGAFDRNEEVTDPEELDTENSPEQATAVLFYPEPSFIPEGEAKEPIPRWRGYDDGTWVGATMMSSSRLNEDNISVPEPETYAGARAVNRLSKNRQKGISVGGGHGNFSGNGSLTRGESSGILDFMDMNGDRFPDVVSQKGIQYSPMTGGLETKQRTAISGIQESETEAFSLGIGGNYAFNEGDLKSGLQMAPLGVSGNFGGSDDDQIYGFMDINGDGLPDKVFENGNAALNLGYKFASPEKWGAVRLGSGESENLSISGSGGFGGGFNDGRYGFAGSVGLSQSKHEGHEGWADINGDGLSDYVQRGGAVALNTGGGFTPIAYPGFRDFSKTVSTDQNGGVYFTLGIPIPLTPIFIIINPGADFSKGISRPEVAIMDIDGDGYADHLTSEKDNSIQVRRNQIGRTNLLKSVERPLGASFSIEYSRDGNTYQLPHSRWNMTRVAVHDGLPGDGVDTLVSTFHYEKGFYHRREREFFGYQTVKTEQRNAEDDDALYRSSTQTYENDNYYEKGLMVSEVTLDAAGNKYLETANEYRLRNVGTGGILEGESLTATVFPELARTEKKFYEGQDEPGVTTYQTFRYDERGNVIHFFDAADAGAADDVESFITYHKDEANYIVGKAKRIIVKGNGQTMRRRDAVFETETGNLKRVVVALGSGTAIHDMTYDRYGNILRQTGPPNQNGQRYSLHYGFDEKLNTYVVQIRDSFGYVSTAEYDPRWGEPVRTTDINGQSITYAHDALGRVTTVTGPYQQGKGRATLTFDYHPEANVPWALTRHFDNYEQAGDPLETVVFIDGLKREVQTKKDGAIGAGKENARDAMIVSGRVVFDFVGRAVRQYFPVTESLGNAGQFNAAFDGVQPTTTRYDVMDRALLTVIPDDTAVRYAYGFGKDRYGKTRFETRVTDANGNSKVNFKDVRGLITSVQEFNAGRTIWTSYRYDPMQQIVQVVDNQNNVTSAQYDLAGRRTHLDSPDMGLTETLYDPASNAVKKTTGNLRAQGQAILYDYTYNRLDGIRYPEYAENNVRYTYGPPGAPHNRADRIVTVSDESGSEERFYGLLGETVKTVRYVSSKTEGSSAHAPEIYVTEYQYDTYNRLRELIYPDGEVLTYGYNSGGLAESVTGKKGEYEYPYLKALTYDKFQQRIYMKQGNGVETEYAYNPLNRRLTTLQGKSNGRTFMDLAYGYDPVGNILSLGNQAKVNRPNDLGGETRYAFKYDDLYRLTASVGSLKQQPNTEHQYTLSMTYDDIHNILAKNQQHVRITPSGGAIEQKKTSYDFRYEYGSARPHAATQIGDRAFSYDANGNQTGWESDRNGTRRNIEWDEENRIQVIRDNGHTMTYKYDHSGERVFKTGPHGETVYVNQFYTVGNRELGSKHVFVGNTRIVTKLVKGQENVTTGGETGDGESGGADSGEDDLHPGNSDPSGNANGHDKDQNVTDPPGNAFGLEKNGSGGSGSGAIIYEPDMFYYHPDHLGTTSFVTDVEGEIFQHVEYFPFGEAWVEEVSNQHRVPYLFTAKELDRETGLYYYGARYYDPRISVWQSADPILELYVDKKINFGVFKSANLSLYSYSYQNPVIFLDPDGNIVESGWDIFNIGIGVASFIANVAAGNIKDAALDGAGIVLDTAAAIVPGVPGGAGTAIKTARATDKSVDLIRGGDKLYDASKAANGISDSGKVIDKADDALKTSKKAKKKYYSKSKRKDAFDKADGKCEYCGEETQIDTPFQKDSAEGDHFVPQSKGGKTTEENLVNSCRDCNGPSGKGGKMPGSEWSPPNPNDRVKNMMDKM